MKTTKYDNISEAITRALPYDDATSHANSTWGELGSTYEVYSYKTLIMRAMKLDGVWQVTYWNPKRYSNTTSKLQKLIASHWPVEDALTTEVPVRVAK